MNAVGGQGPSKAERRAARALVATYHEEKLADLIGHVREARPRYDAGEVDVFELDDVTHHYKRAVKFCIGSGSQVTFAARTLEHWQAEGELPDWWDAGAPRSRR